ncbi:MAG TPA: CheR family methyltransferase [Syntrophales bacterium]|nr:CheR family methyltransferase [Syntrophales bacterium]HOX94419.1 CheR family methyltransferase [Syntrophales bacterium]HPI56820.1 CheR family methyltransferase [Syntrophales bacterium]HPN25742.1 CheR family methyltransferase [Syntrophales bacterium]HQM28707.1 CheR family methyltransferase [Syntrophales bacterium]
MKDDLFLELLEQFRRSPAGYRKVRTGVEKRIRRHMHRLGCENAQAYLERVSEDPSLSGDVEEVLRVSVSRFFRDRAVWEELAVSVLPQLVPNAGPELRVWSAGCALGQEVYSLKILWDRFSRAGTGVPGLALWATDSNPACLAGAMEGLYPRSVLREMPEALRMEYFRDAGDGRHVRVVDRLKEGILWRRHDFTREPPPHGVFQIIFLRNSLLTYYRMDVREAVLPLILEALTTGGVLVIGKGEKLPPVPLRLTPVAPGIPIYRKEASAI